MDQCTHEVRAEYWRSLERRDIFNIIYTRIMGCFTINIFFRVFISLSSGNST